ncbi:MAG TPA: hypothetical protein VHE30_13900 [Polyangiaceae bacterium]|nr:hypothetical protein [Polyangiaceae bacterium]
MLVLTGSKQSGTALWMQILIAAGVPPFGLAPSADPASPGEGESFEASLRQGIYFATNPSPKTGRYVFPEQIEGCVGELHPAGVTRTDRAFIGKVLVTMRPVGEYVVAMRRLHALEDATGRGPPARLDPALEWWAENHSLVKDVAIRRYPARFETQDRLLREPDVLIPDVIRFLGRGDPARGADAVRPEHRRFDSATDLSIGQAAQAVCDELHDTVDRGLPLSTALLAKLDDVHRTLLPALVAEDARVSAAFRAGAR